MTHLNSTIQEAIILTRGVPKSFCRVEDSRVSWTFPRVLRAQFITMQVEVVRGSRHRGRHIYHHPAVSIMYVRQMLWGRDILSAYLK